MPLRKFEKVCEIINTYNKDKSKLIPILQDVQREYRYLPEEIMAYIATSLDIPPAKVFGVASFYAHFALEPRGKHIIRLCCGTACHVKGSLGLLEALRKRLNLTAEKHTTDDMLFTIETVSCLGACGLAPVMVINEDVYGQVTPVMAVNLVEKIMIEENGNETGA
ncbi:MAG: NAD(P)H-dependent oxidoreductase subunit E [Candidatus Auribacterota bacterium]|jgi:NADH-quinone oxidoreductase subunit E|nr:NAD(P)H-dependent oxidoreductase subunit E [Candidatus Auribacterota bacterium]